MKKEIIITIGIIGLLFLLNSCSNTQNIVKTPKIELNTNYFDFGNIDPDKGKRLKTFFVKNIGGSSLEIISVSTSCGCTEAEIESNEIEPDEQTKLTVIYDPSVHPDLVGKIKRIVYIKSNDPLQEEIELELIGNVLPSKKIETKHDDELADFEISPFKVYSKIINKENIRLLDLREESNYIESHIKDSLNLPFDKLSKAELDKLGIKTEDEIIVYDNSGRKGAKAYDILKSLGYKNVLSMNNGITHWIEENLPTEKGNLTTIKPKEEQNNAKISVSPLIYDFGQIPQFGGIVNTTFQIRNIGDTELKINSITTSCSCVSARLVSLVISPTESSTLLVFFNPNLHEEPKDKFTRTVFLETNDPINPELQIKIFVDILEGE